MIKLVPNQKFPTNYSVYAYNGVFIGEIDKCEDGFYKLWINLNNPGYWDEGLLTAIVTQLNTLNAPYQKEINEYYRNQALPTDRLPDSK